MGRENNGIFNGKFLNIKRNRSSKMPVSLILRIKKVEDLSDPRASAVKQSCVLSLSLLGDAFRYVVVHK